MYIYIYIYMCIYIHPNKSFTHLQTPTIMLSGTGFIFNDVRFKCKEDPSVICYCVAIHINYL